MPGNGEPAKLSQKGQEEEETASGQEGEPQEAEGQSDEESEESEQEEEESLSEEEDEEEGEDNEPLSKRAAWNAKHNLPQPTAPARKRNQRFPKIPRSERCGTCENCLNPQRKKACLVARARMEERMRQSGGAGGSAVAPGTRARGAAASAKPPSPVAAVAASADEDPFARSLTGILSSNGGVAQERHVPLLLQLVKRARSKPHRIALLTVLQLSGGEVLRAAVADGLLLQLQTWLSEFVAEGKQAMVQKALACLDKLPVTLASLQPPCELGKIVGRLRKHESFGSAVIEPAKRLVARWKAMVDAAVKSGAGGSSSSTTPAAAAGKAAAAAPAAKAAAAPAAKAAAAGSAAGQLDRQSSGGGAASMEDGDLFKTTDRQRAGIKDAVPSVRKTVTIKTLTVEPTRGVKPAEGAPASKQVEAGGSGGGTAGAARTDVSKVSASPFAALGGLGGLGSGVTVLGGGGSGGMLSAPLSSLGPVMSTAKERAAAAARRVPSPEPQPRKEKKKKVAWLAEEALVGVRWFRKDDPPSAAQKDVDLTKASAAPTATAAREASPPGFESAAKKEHLSEAEALRRHRQEEDQERSELMQRLERMQPTVAWMNPLVNDATSPAEVASMAAPPATGEESTEAAAAAARRQQVPAALYARIADVPDTPAEPGLMADHGMVQRLSTIPRIPLSLEEAALQQKQNQQQQQGGASQQQHSAAAPEQQVPPPNSHQSQQQQHPPGGQVSGALPSGMQQQVMPPPQQQAAAQLPDMGAIGDTLAQLAASGILGAVGASGSGHGPSQQPTAPPPQQQHHQGFPQQQGFPQRQGYQQQHGMQPPGLQRPGPPPAHAPHLAHQPPPAGQMRPPGVMPPAARPPPQQGAMPPAHRPPPHGMLPGQPPPLRPQARPPMQPRMQGHPGPQAGQPRPPYGGQRTCRYFNTPQGCFAGDRCKFAHIPGAGMENGRGNGAKRPAEADYGQRPGKQLRGAGWVSRP